MTKVDEFSHEEVAMIERTFREYAHHQRMGHPAVRGEPLDETISTDNEDIPHALRVRHDKFSSMSGAYKHKVMAKIFERFGLWKHGRETIEEYIQRTREAQERIDRKREREIAHTMKQVRERIEREKERLRRLKAEHKAVRRQDEIQRKLKKVEEELTLELLERDNEELEAEIDEELGDGARRKALDSITKAKLRMLASSMGVELPTKIRKDEIIEKLINAGWRDAKWPI